MNNNKITIIGCGKMGETIVEGIMKNNSYNVNIIEKNIARRKILSTKYEKNIFKKLSDTSVTKIYIIAVKPQDIDIALDELSNVLVDAKGRINIISIAAGIEAKYISDALHKKNRLECKLVIIRVMPNTPAAIGESISAISFPDIATEQSKNIVRKIFNTIGKVIEVSNDKMDAVTALSGSGPAYFYYIAEEMMKFAKKNGIDDSTAKNLITQTIIGAGKYMDESSKSFAELRKDVTSKGGTTEAAIKVLDENKFKKIFNEALTRAMNRSKELSG